MKGAHDDIAGVIARLDGPLSRTKTERGEHHSKLKAFAPKGDDLRVNGERAA